MRIFISILKGILAIIIAYATIVVFALIFQDYLFGGLKVPGSPIHHLLIGGIMTAVGAWIGGYFLSKIATSRPFVYAIILAIWLIVETNYLYFSGITTNPWLFDMAAGSSLSLGVLLGCYIGKMPVDKNPLRLGMN